MMKKSIRFVAFILFIGFILSVTALGKTAVPQPTDAFFVNDFAGVLGSSTERYLQDIAVQLYEETTAQVVVVTIDSLQGEPIEDYAYQLFNEWGIGTEKKDNGVLILVAIGDRQSRVEVGYGLEGALPDGKTGRIQDTYMIPYFRDGDYDSGIENGFLAIVREVYDEYGIEPGNLAVPDRGITIEASDADIANGAFILIVLIVLLVDWIFLRGRITRFFMAASIFGRRGGGGSYRSGSGFRSGGSGFSGGGGRSGGGGSSRRW